MRILGIYIHEAAPEIRKRLHNSCWYPFGKIDDCSSVFFNDTNYDYIKNQVIVLNDFTNNLYKIPESQYDPKININCIVGKNGCGKSTLLQIYNLIINNFAYKLADLFSDELKSDFSPSWANGINADLYFELNQEIGAIKIENNEVLEENSNPKVNFYYKKLVPLDEIHSDNDIQNLIFNNFFYTIFSNYSLYNSNNQNSDWLDNLYQKNDGYITPIVLLPYRNKGIIDLNKETNLAEQRVLILSILLAMSGKNFIEGCTPANIDYSIKNPESYKKNINKKIQRIILDCDSKILHDNLHYRDDILLKIHEIWENLLSDYFKDEMIKDNSLTFLSYKTLKIFLVYKTYYEEFLNGDIFEEYHKNETDCINHIKLLIESKLSDENHVDHINLKIIQCIFFLKNQYYPLKSSYISVKSFCEELKKKKDIISYDDIFINLLPDFYYTNLKYWNRSEKPIYLSEMSSGQQQLLFSLSYFIYHIKNIISIQNTGNRFFYKNISLILDEAELYYHPDLQRRFISDLLDVIHRSYFNNENTHNIDSINITIVTHSPYLLSDIPNLNILAINEDGSPKVDLCETLGANIYDILKSPFFMDSSCGEITTSTIKMIIETNFNKITDSKKFFFKMFIDNLGDQYIRHSLLDTYYEKNGLSYEERHLEKLKNEIKEIEEKLKCEK